jgi:hypothetical protein
MLTAMKEGWDRIGGEGRRPGSGETPGHTGSQMWVGGWGMWKTGTEASCRARAKKRHGQSGIKPVKVFDLNFKCIICFINTHTVQFVILGSKWSNRSIPTENSQYRCDSVNPETGMTKHWRAALERFSWASPLLRAQFPLFLLTSWLKFFKWVLGRKLPIQKWRSYLSQEFINFCIAIKVSLHPPIRMDSNTVHF